jgi:RNA-directed DNA polymerase
MANLVFVKTGIELQKFAFQNQITFTSFVDDLTFSAPLDFKDKVGYIINAIQKDGYKISHSKTNYKTKNPMVTGLIVKNNNLALPNSFKIKLIEPVDKTEEQKKGFALYADRVKKA